MLTNLFLLWVQLPSADIASGAVIGMGALWAVMGVALLVATEYLTSIQSKCGCFASGCATHAPSTPMTVSVIKIGECPQVHILYPVGIVSSGGRDDNSRSWRRAEAQGKIQG